MFESPLIIFSPSRLHHCFWLLVAPNEFVLVFWSYVLVWFWESSFTHDKPLFGPYRFALRFELPDFGLKKRIPIMPGCSPSPKLARILFFTTIFIFGLLIAVSVWNCVAYYTPDDSSSSAETSTLIEQPLAEDNGTQSLYAERGLGVGSLSHIVPSPISGLLPDTATSLWSNITGDLNGLATIMNSSSIGNSEAMSLSDDQPTLPITLQPEPTSSEVAALAGKLGSLLDGAVPLAAPSIIREATSQAQVLAASVEAIATDIASVAGQVDASQLPAPDALKTAEDLLESLDAAVGSIAKNIMPTSGLPAPILDDLSKAMSSDLGDIVKVANGPISLVGDLIEDNICEITIIVDDIPSTVAGLCGDMTSAVDDSASASITESSASNTQASSTTEVPLSATFSNSANIASWATSLTSPTLATLASSGSSLPINPPGSASQTTMSLSPNAADGSGSETGKQMSTSSEVISPAGMSRGTTFNIQPSNTPSVTSASVSPQSGPQNSAPFTSIGAGSDSNGQPVPSTSNEAGAESVTGESNLTTIPRPSLTASVHPGIGVSSRVTTTGSKLDTVIL